jgi:hypothetical protein
VSLGLHRDTQAVLVGMTYDCGNLLCVARPCHHRGPLVDRQVKRRSRGIPLLVASLNELRSI